jgi:hypothetical protein
LTPPPFQTTVTLSQYCIYEKYIIIVFWSNFHEAMLMNAFTGAPQRAAENLSKARPNKWRFAAF